LKIDAIRANLYRLPPAVPWEDATHRVSGLEYAITQVTTNTGLTGVGFAYTTGIGGSAVLALINDYLAGMLIGEDPLAVSRLWSRMNRELHRCGLGGINTFALAALDIALWDIMGQHQGMPLHRLLGAACDRVPAYASGIDLFMSEAELLAEVDSFLEAGFDTIKIKIGKDDPHEDAGRVMAVRRLIGPRRRLMVDANQKWTVWEAIPRLQLLQAAQLTWVEEPLHAEDLAGHGDLRRIVKIPLAIGESLYTKHQFMEFLRADAVDIVQADVCRVGGITEWMSIAHLSAAFHRPVAPHYLPEISASVLCGVENGLMLEWVRGGSFTELGVLYNPIRLKQGTVLPFDDPGHGIKFDFDKLSAYEVSSERLRRQDLTSAKS
jgi:L-alanine-DL-glutamate epimerase-like enolase superfamily enzyme